MTTSISFKIVVIFSSSMVVKIYLHWYHEMIIENDVGRNNAASIHPLRREFRMPTRGDVRTPVIYG